MKLLCRMFRPKGLATKLVSCDWCKRIVCWKQRNKIKMGGEDYDWKNEAAYQTMKERGNGCCSEECSIKQDEKLAKENQKKCADCQQKKDNLITIQGNNQTIKICPDCKQRRDNEPQEESPEPVSLENEDIYCENCDKWLDNPTDYTKKSGWNVKCNSCQSTVKVVKGEKESEIGYYPLNVIMLVNTYCYVCGRKNCWSEEGIKWWEEDNKHKKPNWKKRKRERMAIQHDWKDWKLTLRHDCYLNCPLGGGCGKKFKVNQKTAPLFQWRHLQVFHDERCASCRLKEFKELITLLSPSWICLSSGVNNQGVFRFKASLSINFNLSRSIRALLIIYLPILGILGKLIA